MKRILWEQLTDWKNNNDRKPLILKGARQVGKTYLLKQFGRECFPQFHYFNFEEEPGLERIFDLNLNPDRIVNELSFHVNTEINISSDLVVFDEIQNAPKALNSLKYFHEKMPNLALCAAGSLLGIHLSAEAFPVGSVTFLHLAPLSFEEFLLAVEDTRSYDFISNYSPKTPIPEIIHQHLWAQLKNYFIVGGLPEIVKTYANGKAAPFQIFTHIRKKQRDLITAYQADMAKHSGKQNAMHLERIWANVPAQLAKEENGSAPKYIFKGTIPGYNRYSQLIGSIDWLITAGLVIKVPILETIRLPLSAYQAENCFKLYLFDVGILGALSNLSPKDILGYDFGSYKGYFAENHIAQALTCAHYSELFSWRGRMSEVEFVVNLKNNIVPVEVKSGWVTHSKSLSVYNSKYHPIIRFVLSAKNVQYGTSNGLIYYPLYLAGKLHQAVP